MPKKLTLGSKANESICGVCSGLADYFDMDSTLIRVIFIILTLCTSFPMIIFYLILAICLPKYESNDHTPGSNNI